MVASLMSMEVGIKGLFTSVFHIIRAYPPVK
jgi:hypothetical protein